MDTPSFRIDHDQMESFQRQTSFSSGRSTSGLDKREIQDVLIGNLTVQHSPLSRTIRLYISSEWADCEIERQHLFSNVMPNLRHFCQTLGLQFHAIDLFCALPTLLNNGDRHNATTDDTISNTILCDLERRGALNLIPKEIELCRRVSAGPTFVTFLAQKYGYKALQTTIPKEDFILLLTAVDDNSSKKLIQDWYKLDSNARPHEYVLQSGKDSGVSLKEWVVIHESLSKAIRRAAKVALGRDVSKVQHYTMSVIEEEATIGIFNLKENPNQYCLWFKRIFSDLMEQRPNSDSALHRYADLMLGRKELEFNTEAMKTLNHLKEARMPAKYIGLDSTNIFEFSLKWQKNKGLDPTENPTHSEYLSELAKSVQSTLMQMIADTADLLEVQLGGPAYQEALCHGQHCKEKAQVFWDRRDITTQMYQYIVSDSTVPLVVHGETGSGKTSIMAHVACHIKEEYPLMKMILVLRFIGITPNSFNIRSTLRSICEQISIVFKEEMTAIPGDYKAITKHFETLLSKATKENPIYIFLDGVDHLSPDDGATGMSWLPLSLPPNVKIILSTSSEVKYHCLPVLQSLLSDCQQNFIKIPPLNGAECRNVMRHVLASQGRELTKTQEEKAVKVFAQCPLPLYLQFLVRDLKSWHSYDHSSWETFPPSSLEGVCVKFITSLEEEYGHCFVARVLGYITATKHGLSEMELLKILSSDQTLMRHLKGKWYRKYMDCTTLQDVSQLPPLLWSQFYNTLLPFLELRMGVEQILVFRWSCRLLVDVVTKHYLRPGESATTEMFMNLAEYFNGSLMKEDGTSTRDVVAEQPIMLNGEKRLWNVRKLTELPYCLAKSGRTEELKQLLTDYVWLYACVSTMPCANIINWFSDVLAVVPLGRSDCDRSTESEELRLLRDALCFSIPVLNLDSSQLSVQLLSRLMPYITDSEAERPLLKQLVVKALEDHPPAITPLHPTKNVPGGPYLVTMEGHRDAISSIATALTRNVTTGEYQMCILSASWDKTLKTWDLKSTGVMKTFDGHTDQVLSCALTLDAQYAVSGSADKSVRNWRVATGECLCTMTGHTAAVNTVLISSDGSKTISGSSDTTVRIWNSDLTSSSYGQLIYTMKNSRSQVLSLSWCDGMNIAIGYKDGVVHVNNIISAETLQTFQDHDAEGIVCLAFVKLANGCSYLASGSKQGYVVIRNMHNGEIVHTLSIESGPVRSVSVSANGKLTMAGGDRRVSVWDVHSGSYLFSFAEQYSSDVHSISMADCGSLAITGSSDFSIRIWDLKSPPVSHTTRYHKSDTTTVSVSLCGMYAVSGSQDSSIKIYDLESMAVLKTLQSHQGTINDVVILRDSKHLLSGSADGSIRLWDGETEELVCTYQDVNVCSEVNCVAISADSELLMSGNEDGVVAFWSVKSGKLLKTFINHKSAVVAVTFAHCENTKYIVSASRDGQVCARDFYTAKVLLSKRSHTDDLLCLGVSRDGAVFATGSKDKECHVVSLPNGSLNAVLTGHRGPVQSVRIIQGGRSCITASTDCTLCIWDIHQSECIATLHTDLPILCCDVDRHDEKIVYGTKDGWVSTALYVYQDQTSSYSDQNPMMKRLRGVVSPSASSLTETDSSQSSMLMQTEAKVLTDSVTMVDASFIPLPPSEDEEPSLDDKSTLSQSSIIIARPQREEDNQHRAHEVEQEEAVALTTSAAGDIKDNEGSMPLPTTLDLMNDSSQLKKSISDHDGFGEHEISTILKIKSEIIGSDRGSIHSHHEDVDSDVDKNKTVNIPPTSSACTML